MGWAKAGANHGLYSWGNTAIGRERGFFPGCRTTLPTEAKCVLAQGRLQSVEQAWEACSFAPDLLAAIPPSHLKQRPPRHAFIPGYPSHSLCRGMFPKLSSDAYRVVELNAIHMCSWKKILLAEREDIPAIHSTLSQPNRTLSICHSLFLKEFSSSPHAPLHLVWGSFYFLQRPFQASTGHKKDHNQKPSSGAHLKRLWVTITVMDLGGFIYNYGKWSWKGSLKMTLSASFT